MTPLKSLPDKINHSRKCWLTLHSQCVLLVKQNGFPSPKNQLGSNIYLNVGYRGRGSSLKLTFNLMLYISGLQPWASRCSWTTTARSLHHHLYRPGFLGVEVQEHLEAQGWGPLLYRIVQVFCLSQYCQF